MKSDFENLQELSSASRRLERFISVFQTVHIYPPALPAYPGGKY